jgi:hypothetical protein
MKSIAKPFIIITIVLLPLQLSVFGQMQKQAETETNQKQYFATVKRSTLGKKLDERGFATSSIPLQAGMTYLVEKQEIGFVTIREDDTLVRVSKSDVDLKLVATTQVTYTDVLLAPEKYIGTQVAMRGEFRYKNTDRESFDMQQGDNTIEVFYKRLPKEKQAAILSQENFSKLPVSAKGTLQRFTNTDNSYYIMAREVLWE